MIARCSMPAGLSTTCGCQQSCWASPGFEEEPAGIEQVRSSARLAHGPYSPEPDRFIGCSLTSSRNTSGGIVTDRVEVELRSGEVGPVEVRRQIHSSPYFGPASGCPSGPMMQLPPGSTRPAGRSRPVG